MRVVVGGQGWRGVGEGSSGWSRVARGRRGVGEGGERSSMVVRGQ